MSTLSAEFALMCDEVAAGRRWPAQNHPGKLQCKRTDEIQQGRGSAVWISVLGLSFVMAVHPLRLGVTLLVISRPRAGKNLFASWVGGRAVGFPGLLFPLLVLH